MAASAAAFALVNYGMWVEVDDDLFWRATGVVAIAALDGAHACFVLARRRGTDPEAVKLATGAAAVTAAISGTFGILAATGLADDGPWQLLAVVLVIQLLATALAPLLRRMAGEQPTSTADGFGRTRQRDIAGELRVIADELDDAKSPAAVHELADRLGGRMDVSPARARRYTSRWSTPHEAPGPRRVRLVSRRERQPAAEGSPPPTTSSLPIRCRG